jgi:hypothetical protein
MSRSLAIISIIIGWIGVSISPMFDSVIVSEGYNLSQHRLGFPMPIIEQHTWLTPMEDAFPFKLGLVNPQEHPTDILFLNYFLSIVMVAVMIYLFMVVIKLIIRKTKRVKL